MRNISKLHKKPSKLVMLFAGMMTSQWVAAHTGHTSSLFHSHDNLSTALIAVVALTVAGSCLLLLNYKNRYAKNRHNQKNAAAKMIEVRSEDHPKGNIKNDA